MCLQLFPLYRRKTIIELEIRRPGICTRRISLAANRHRHLWGLIEKVSSPGYTCPIFSFRRFPAQRLDPNSMNRRNLLTISSRSLGDKVERHFSLLYCTVDICDSFILFADEKIPDCHSD